MCQIGVCLKHKVEINKNLKVYYVCLFQNLDSISDSEEVIAHDEVLITALEVDAFADMHRQQVYEPIFSDPLATMNHRNCKGQQSLPF